jgi:hypothetical protein
VKIGSASASLSRGQRAFDAQVTRRDRSGGEAEREGDQDRLDSYGRDGMTTSSKHAVTMNGDTHISLAESMPESRPSCAALSASLTGPSVSRSASGLYQRMWT